MPRRPLHLLHPLLACIFWLANAQAVAATTSPEAKRCLEKGWLRHTMPVAGLERELLWKAPSGPWTKGAILVLHGGGGRHDNWCAARAAFIEPQVRFSEMAVAEGYAVFLLDSSDRVTDRDGRPCGKLWDDEVKPRPNLDLPFIGAVMRELIPGLRPAGSAKMLFITGLSSGGYMAVRASTHFDDMVTAFAPVSSGDPYGWHRICKAGTTLRIKVHGKGYDNETGKHIVERDSCRADAYPNEQPWESANPAIKPAFRVFHHREDGISDQSCAGKVSRLLRQKGYRGQPDFVLHGGRRSLANHLWLDDYNRPILEFFAGHDDKKVK